MNKIWYGIFGGREILKPTNKNIAEFVTLNVDGKDVELHESTEGIILSNIASYGGGAHLWVDQPEDNDAAPEEALPNERFAEDVFYSLEPFSPLGDV